MAPPAVFVFDPREAACQAAAYRTLRQVLGDDELSDLEEAVAIFGVDGAMQTVAGAMPSADELELACVWAALHYIHRHAGARN